MSAQAIHDDLVATLGYKALAYSTVTKYLRTARFDPAKDPPNNDASSHHLDDSDQAILAALEERPFSSVCELARACTSHPSSTHDRSQETEQLTWLCTTSSSLGAIPVVVLPGVRGSESANASSSSRC
jgi:hypothetical protein